MKTEARVFIALVPFFLIVGIGYGLWSDWEAVGSIAVLLMAGLVGMIGFYLALVSRRIDPRPEDNPYGEIEDGAGEQGVFSPWSWWPITLGAAAALVFLGVAIGTWIFLIGVTVAVVALVGWTYEYYRGYFAS